MKIKINFFESQGVRMKYFEMGEGEPVIFLHGVGVKAMIYKKLLDLLSKKYHVIAPDLPCFGGSSVPKEIWNFEDYAKFLNEFIDSLNLESIVLIGHSFGGGIALHLASKSTKISKIIVANSAGIVRVESLFLSFPNFFIKKTINDLFINPVILFFALKAFLLNVAHKFLHLPIIFKIVIKTMKEEPINLEKIMIPSLILWGKNDEIFQCRDKSRLVPTSFVQIESISGNHDWILFKPELLIEKIVALR